MKPFSVNDEWYYHMRFVKDLKGVTPILTDVPLAKTLKRPDGARSGNPAVRKAVSNGESQHVAWAYERPDGARGFGFTGGHVHMNWQQEDNRKLMLNALRWYANVDSTKGGMLSKTPTKGELHSNFD